jgi:hypothetical protein
MTPISAARHHAPRRVLICLLTVTASALAVGLSAAAAPAGADSSPSGPSHIVNKPRAAGTDYAQCSAAKAAQGVTVHYAVPKAACPAAAKGRASCMAVRLLPVAKGTKGAKAYVTPATNTGPLNGYGPADLANAYAYDRTIGGATQTVAIVDAFDDPTALTDLNAFNSQYSLPAETGTSFRKVNQNGAASPLPVADAGWSTEIALDIETVRAVCAQCKILLVEANSDFSDDLAAAVNQAALLGATEISNSYGGPEASGQPAGIQAAYHHTGVVITASTGDDGWYDWDRMNENGGASSNVPSTPASYPDVVAVGGTALTVNATSRARQAESVWNENGLDDQTGLASGPQGASGGGCSTLYTAHTWQSQLAGYSTNGCGTKRLAADIAADADPNTGVDVYVAGSWTRVGGTSLAAPLIASMWALAGGSGGVDYPARSLYYNLTHTPTSVYDVTAGGNSFCRGDSQAHCAAAVKADVGGGTGNPNALADANGWLGLLDCGFRYDGAAGPKPDNKQCNATTGYDGPSGVGTPNGLSVFTPAPPSATIQPPIMKLNTVQTYTATGFTDPVPTATAATYMWHWGDGTPDSLASASASATHSYALKGSYPVTLTLTDSVGHVGTTTRTITVGLRPTAVLTGNTTWHVNTTARWTSSLSTDPNTGGSFTIRHWKFGTTVYGTSTAFSHKFTTVGKRTLTLVLVDNEGLQATKSIIVNVIK